MSVETVDQLQSIVEPRTLPPDFEFPKAIETVITKLLIHTRDDLLNLREGRDYEPDPDRLRIFNQFDTIFIKRETRELDQEEFVKQLDFWVRSVPSKHHDAATQLRDMGVIMGYTRDQNFPAATKTFLEEFCRDYQINPDNPDTVFDSQVQDSGLQALALRYIALARPEFDFVALETEALALRWYFLDKGDNFTVRGLLGSLNTLAMRAMEAQNSERAVELFEAAEELALAAEDPAWRMIAENKIMELCRLDRYEEATHEYDELYSQAAESLSPVARAWMDGNRLVTWFGFYRAASAQQPDTVSEEEWGDLATLIRNRAQECKEFGLTGSVLELKIALAGVERAMNNDEKAMAIEASLIPMMSQAYTSKEEVEMFTHPALISTATRIFQAAQEAGSKDEAGEG